MARLTATDTATMIRLFSRYEAKWYVLKSRW